MKKSNNRNYNMKAYTYIEKGKFAFVEKQIPEIQEATDAIVRVTLGSICTSDLHKTRKRAKSRTGHYRRARDGGHSRGYRQQSERSEGRRPSDGKRGDLLRRMLLLQAWLR